MGGCDSSSKSTEAIKKAQIEIIAKVNSLIDIVFRWREYRQEIRS